MKIKDIKWIATHSNEHLVSSCQSFLEIMWVLIWIMAKDIRT